MSYGNIGQIGTLTRSKTQISKTSSGQMTEIPTKAHPHLARDQFMTVVGIVALLAAFVTLTVDVIEGLFDWNAQPNQVTILAMLSLIWQSAAAIGLAFAVRILQLEMRRWSEEKMRTQATIAILRGEFHKVVVQRFSDWALTPAERDIAILILKGMSGVEISSARTTATGTVRAQTTAIFRKAGVKSRTEFLSVFLDEFFDPDADLPDDGRTSSERRYAH